MNIHTEPVMEYEFIPIAMERDGIWLAVVDCFVNGDFQWRNVLETPYKTVEEAQALAHQMARFESRAVQMVVERFKSRTATE